MIKIPMFQELTIFQMQDWLERNELPIPTFCQEEIKRLLRQKKAEVAYYTYVADTYDIRPILIRYCRIAAKLINIESEENIYIVLSKLETFCKIDKKKFEEQVEKRLHELCD